MAEVTTSVEIAASAAHVWTVLTDFAQYPQWNPFVVSATGSPVVGGKLRVRLKPPGGRAMTFRPRVLVATRERELRWLGRVLVPGLFDGEHRFVIEPTGAASCRFTQAETFRGVLVPVLRSRFDQIQAGFDEMNAALKHRAERFASTGSAN
jgi:hypothetical protein